MQQTRERPRTTQRVGLFRRFLLGEDSGMPLRFRDGPAEYIDLREGREWDETTERIERLEVGMRLLVEAMKRSHGRLAAAIQDLGSRAGVGVPLEEIERVVGGALTPIAESLGEVAETLRTLPYVVAAAADHVDDVTLPIRAAAERSAAEEQASIREATTSPSPDRSVLPVVPFELEEVEEAFDPLTALRRARFAVEELDAI